MLIEKKGEFSSPAKSPGGSTKESPGYFEILKNFPDFRRLYTARTISLLGDWFNLIALLAMLRETINAGPEIISGLFILKILPNFFVGIPAGVVADRISRKRIMIASDIIRFFLTLAFFIVPFFPEQSIPIVYILTAIQISASSFFEPARTASIPNLVSPDALGGANALGAATWSVMFTLGTGLGGIVTEFLGWRAALWIDAFTFLVSAYIIRGAVIPQALFHKPIIRDFGHITGFSDLLAGIHFVKRNFRVLSMVLLKSGWCIAGGIVFLLTLYGQQRYHFGFGPDVGVAVLMMSRAAGTGFGPVLARFICKENERKMRIAIRYGFFLGAIFYIAFSFINIPWLACVFVFFAHIGGSTVWVLSTVLLQKIVPDRIRGRVFALDLGLSTLILSLSIFVYGQISTLPYFSLEKMSMILGISLLLPASLWTWFGSKRYFPERPISTNGSNQ